jgi:hypothetical protein
MPRGWSGHPQSWWRILMWRIQTHKNKRWMMQSSSTEIKLNFSSPVELLASFWFRVVQFSNW